MSMPDPAISTLLYEALAEPIGLLCHAMPSLEKARAKLYSTRKQIADPALSVLQFRASPWPEEGNLLITKTTVEVSAADA